MTIDEIARRLRALTPTEKMELADRLYDQAVADDVPSRPRLRRRRQTVIDAAAVTGPAIEPWAGFSERRLGR